MVNATPAATTLAGRADRLDDVVLEDRRPPELLSTEIDSTAIGIEAETVRPALSAR